MLYNLLFLGFLITTKVVLNLERINPYVIHTGITFKRLNRNIGLGLDDPKGSNFFNSL